MQATNCASVSGAVSARSRHSATFVRAHSLNMILSGFEITVSSTARMRTAFGSMPRSSAGGIAGPGWRCEATRGVDVGLWRWRRGARSAVRVVVLGREVAHRLQAVAAQVRRHAARGLRIVLDGLRWILPSSISFLAVTSWTVTPKTIVDLIHSPEICARSVVTDTLVPSPPMPWSVAKPWSRSALSDTAMTEARSAYFDLKNGVVGTLDEPPHVLLCRDERGDGCW